MDRVIAGVMAGLFATACLFILMVLKSASGVLPELDFIGLISGALTVDAKDAWLIHVCIGMLWGVIFTSQVRSLHGAYWLRGATLAIAPWFVMMAVLTPALGGGFFGLLWSPYAPLLMLLLHLGFGAAWGFAFAAFARPTTRRRRVRHVSPMRPAYPHESADEPIIVSASFSDSAMNVSANAVAGALDAADGELLNTADQAAMLSEAATMET